MPKFGMKDDTKVLLELRNEFMQLDQKLAALKFAMATLSLTSAELDLMNEQKKAMQDYNVMLMGRANIVAQRIHKGTLLFEAKINSKEWGAK